ncbi:MAG: FHA domain-containing protein [Coleofasciculaceae cyanobacterium]
MATQQYFTLIIEDDYGRREFILYNDIYSICKHLDCDIYISKYSSRRNATLIRKQHTNGSIYYQIIDGDLTGTSVNGLLINGRKMQTHDLENEDEIVLSPGVSAKYYIKSHF